MGLFCECDEWLKSCDRCSKEYDTEQERDDLRRELNEMVEDYDCIVDGICAERDELRTHIVDLEKRNAELARDFNAIDGCWEKKAENLWSILKRVADQFEYEKRLLHSGYWWNNAVCPNTLAKLILKGIRDE